MKINNIETDKFSWVQKFWISKSRFYLKNYHELSFVFYKIKDNNYIVDRKIGPALIIENDTFKSSFWANNGKGTRKDGPLRIYASGDKNWIFDMKELNKGEEIYWNE